MVSAWEIDEGSGGRESNLVSAAAGREILGGNTCGVDDKQEETGETILAKSPRQSRAYAALMQVGPRGPAGQACNPSTGGPIRECTHMHAKIHSLTSPSSPLTLGALTSLSSTDLPSNDVYRWMKILVQHGQVQTTGT
jgi:hypothetical protein